MVHQPTTLPVIFLLEGPVRPPPPVVDDDLGLAQVLADDGAVAAGRGVHYGLRRGVVVVEVCEGRWVCETGQGRRFCPRAVLAARYWRGRVNPAMGAHVTAGVPTFPRAASSHQPPAPRPRFEQTPPARLPRKHYWAIKLRRFPTCASLRFQLRCSSALFPTSPPHHARGVVPRLVVHPPSDGGAVEGVHQLLHVEGPGG